MLSRMVIPLSIAYHMRVLLVPFSTRSYWYWYARIYWNIGAGAGAGVLMLMLSYCCCCYWVCHSAWGHQINRYLCHVSLESLWQKLSASDGLLWKYGTKNTRTHNVVSCEFVSYKEKLHVHATAQHVVNLNILTVILAITTFSHLRALTHTTLSTRMRHTPTLHFTLASLSPLAAALFLFLTHRFLHCLYIHFFRIVYYECESLRLPSTQIVCNLRVRTIFVCSIDMCMCACVWPYTVHIT